MDRTKDLRGSQSLLFISFKKGHTSDIRPATLSSWLKQNILVYFVTTKQINKPWTWSKSKHMTEPLRPLRPFTVGYQWIKSCKRVNGKLTTHLQIFYLKDLTLSDNDNNMYLGPVVAAQQVLHPSPQTTDPRKEKKGGGAHPLQPSLQESNPRV